MWLPKVERDLLIFYFRKIKDTKNGRSFPGQFELIDAIGYVPTFRRILRYLKLWLDYEILRNLKRLFHVKISNVIPPVNDTRFDKAHAANERLHQRGLIELKEDLMVTHVKQTLQGWDIGRKYSNLLIRFGLWFAEYKDCGLGLVIGAILGIVGTIIVNRLSQG